MIAVAIPNNLAMQSEWRSEQNILQGWNVYLRPEMWDLKWGRREGTSVCEGELNYIMNEILRFIYIHILDMRVRYKLRRTRNANTVKTKDNKYTLFLPTRAGIKRDRFATGNTPCFKALFEPTDWNLRIVLSRDVRRLVCCRLISCSTELVGDF